MSGSALKTSKPDYVNESKALPGMCVRAVVESLPARASIGRCCCPSPWPRSNEGTPWGIWVCEDKPGMDMRCKPPKPPGNTAGSSQNVCGEQRACYLSLVAPSLKDTDLWGHSGGAERKLTQASHICIVYTAP